MHRRKKKKTRWNWKRINIAISVLVLLLGGTIWGICAHNARVRKDKETLAMQENLKNQMNDDKTLEDKTFAEETSAKENESTENSTQETTEEESTGETKEENTEATQVESDQKQTEPSKEEETDPPKVQDFVSDWPEASIYTQLVVVESSGVTATVTMHSKDSGEWVEIMRTSGYVGSEGVGEAGEEYSRTPAGTYTLTRSFGVNKDPGTALPYTQVNDNHYWVDDPTSKYYNQFVSIDKVSKDWSSAEHLVDYPTQYAYAIGIDYNMSCVPGKGSAIFLHCSNGRSTAGCVAIPQNNMYFILKNIGINCAIIIK
jgi:L,D-peptidoglycan transpeptidase YkuD (ErfK/YbiS/YcfS/YnhG family)